MEEIKAHGDSLKSQPVVDGYHSVTVVRQLFEPREMIRIVAASGYETASENEQYGRLEIAVRKNDGLGIGSVIVDVEIARIALGHQISPGELLGMHGRAEQQQRRNQDKTFHIHLVPQ